MGLLLFQELASKIKNWRWGAFAIFVTLYSGVCFILAIIWNSYYTFLERLACSIGIISLLALWGLALQKGILSRLFWRLAFFVDALLFVVCLIYGRKYDLPLLWWLIAYAIAVSIDIPYFIGLFIYAFRSKHIWEGDEPKPVIAPVIYPHDIKFRRKEVLQKCMQSLKFLITISLIIFCLTFAPIIIRNNRVFYPEEYSPRYIKQMLEYRRTTIPQLAEFERLFPNHLYAFGYSDTDFVSDPNDNASYADLKFPFGLCSSAGPHSTCLVIGDDVYHPDPNSPVRWRLSAGLHKRYLMVMETDIIFAELDPNTKEVISPGSHEEPVFSLWEVLHVSISPRFVLTGERFVSTDRKKLKTFTTAEWQRLVQANGDFSVLGIALKKDDPVPDFDRACWNNK